MGRCRSLGSLKLLLSYASQLPGASFLCVFFHSLSSSVLTIGSGCSPMPARSQVLFSFLVSLGLSNSHLEGCNHNDCDIFVYWYGRNTPFLMSLLRTLHSWFKVSTLLPRFPGLTSQWIPFTEIHIPEAASGKPNPIVYLISPSCLATEPWVYSRFFFL